MWNRFVADSTRNSELQMAVKWHSKARDCTTETAGALKDNKVTFAGKGDSICSRLQRMKISIYSIYKT
jgi:hypothetical protein